MTFASFKNARIVRSRWLEEGGRRLDCNPYMSGALEARDILANLSVPLDPLAEVVEDVFHAGRDARVWVADLEHGVPFLGSTDILAADLSTLPRISKRIVKSNPLFRVGEKWTLITRSGTVGRMAYVRQDAADMACSEHVLRVVPNKKKVAPGYLHAFLASKFGVPLVVAGTYGAIIQHIERQHILDRVSVPRYSTDFEESIARKIDEYSTLLTYYQDTVCRATDQFFRSVGLEDISRVDWHENGPDLGFEIKGVTSTSLRAMNYSPRFDELVRRIKSVPHKLLGEVCVDGTLKRGGRYKRIEASPEHAYLMVGQKQVFWLEPEGQWIAKSCVDEDVLVPPGAILIAGAGTLGESEAYCRTEFIWNDASRNAFSELFVRVISDPNEMLCGCLYAFMRSEMAFRMLRSTSFGSKLQYPMARLVKSLPIPIPDRPSMVEIHELVISAYEAREKAVRLKHEAIARLERQIEGGGR